jgi:DNA-binding beta-propeller fold protein YncE
MLTTLAFYTVLSATPIPLPGGAPVVMDYLVFDAATQTVWVPAGNTGNVDVVDTSGKVTPIAGFPTAPSPRPGRPNMGPSSATVADGAVWVGNRADRKLCAIDAKSHAKGACVELSSMPDGLAWVATTRELWATTPRDQTITIVSLKDKAPGVPATLKLDGEPEGYAVDAARGVFYTNLEDKDKTLAIDVKTRKVVSTWAPGCGADGPRGIALDAARRLLFVACTDGAVTLDLAHDGKPVGRLKTGSGVDNIDYHADKRLLYVASGKDATLTIAKIADGGAPTVVGTAPTGAGARVVIVDGKGTAYVADSMGGRLVVVKPPAP